MQKTNGSNSHHRILNSMEEEVKKVSLVVISVLLITAVLLSACTSSGATKVRVASDATWPPFEMVDETTKELTGFDIEMVNAIAKEAGLDSRICQCRL